MAEWTERKEVEFLFDIGGADGEEEIIAEVEVQYSGGAVMTLPRVEEVEILSVRDAFGNEVEYEKFVGLEERISDECQE